MEAYAANVYRHSHMTTQLVFATNNPNKLAEARQIVGESIQILSLEDIQCHIELPETHDTLEENALEKARFVSSMYGVNCFAEDTGLEVEALGGEPGVYSARYAGPDKSSSDNIALLLKKMEGKTHRKARFRTVIALILEGKEYVFEGVITGDIAEYPDGDWGFGYDPVFIPEGSSVSFARMPPEVKNSKSHRRQALVKMMEFLKNNQSLSSS
ncbi:MAG: non-canonical purine NTP pyrophosphatase [Chitinophagales bacterium]|nr:MAG: non-canonical purine NTP pyrophosphatase [Chitinophagales bacterium]